MTLAIGSYKPTTALADTDEVLSLAWTLDERDCFGEALRALLNDCLHRELEERLPYVDRYFVHDPYAESELADTLADAFGADAAALRISTASGVNSLLHALSALAVRGAYVIGEVYPDFIHWARMRAGFVACGGAAATTAAAHVEATRASGAAIVLLDRPAMCGSTFSLDELEHLCSGLRGHALVVVDESYANYLPPSFSAAGLASRLDNLCVLRGLSKGYQLGSLRIGYALAGAAATAQVRAVLPAMQVSSLSLRLAGAVLRGGDLAAPLRARVAVAKPLASACLARSRYRLTPSQDAVPYLFLADGTEGSAERLRASGIAGKWQPFWDGAAGRMIHRYRLSVPLSPSRLHRLGYLLEPSSSP